MPYSTAGSPAGITAETVSYDAAVTSGPDILQIYGSVKLVSTTVDSGNSGNTTTIRAGNILAKVTATGLFTVYNFDAIDGTQIPICVLRNTISMIGDAGVVADKDVSVVLSGILQTANLVAAGQDGGLDAAARNMLSKAFKFDDDYTGALVGIPFLPVVTKAADYTLTAADSGKKFVSTTGAVTFTLPTIAHGLSYELRSSSDNNLVVTGASASLLRSTSGVLGTTATMSTSASKLGAGMRIQAIYDATTTLVWELTPLSGSFVITMS